MIQCIEENTGKKKVEGPQSTTCRLAVSLLSILIDICHFFKTLHAVCITNMNHDQTIHLINQTTKTSHTINSTVLGTILTQKAHNITSTTPTEKALTTGSLHDSSNGEVLSSLKFE